MNKLIDEISCSCFSEILFEVSEDLRGFKNETVCIYLLIKLQLSRTLKKLKRSDM